METSNLICDYSRQLGNKQDMRRRYLVEQISKIKKHTLNSKIMTNELENPMHFFPSTDE